MATTSGECLCGSVKVIIEGSLESFDSLMCHCSSCKRRSGSVASYAFLVPKKKVTINDQHSKHVAKLDYNTGSGKPMTRTMCSDCGSPIIIIEGHAEDVRCLQYGLFAVDGKEIDLPKPRMELFRKYACAWESVIGEEVKDEQ